MLNLLGQVHRQWLMQVAEQVVALPELRTQEGDNPASVALSLVSTLR